MVSNVVSKDAKPLKNPSKEDKENIIASLKEFEKSKKQYKEKQQAL